MPIIENLPYSEYDKRPGCRKSMFKSLMRSGLDFRHYLKNGKTSKFMEFGSLVDTIIFEPSEYDTRYITHPDTYPGRGGDKPWSWASTYCKEWRVDVPIGVSIISTDDLSRANKIIENIKSHVEASKWLSGASYQVSMFWVDEDTEVDCKGRPDIICGGIDGTAIRIPDLKVTYDPHPEAFSSIVYKFAYHAAAAYYHDGYFLSQGITPDGDEPIIPMSFIAVESDEPYDVVCYDLDSETFSIGRNYYKQALERYKEFTQHDEYQGYSNTVEEIGIPQWAKNKYSYEGRF